MYPSEIIVCEKCNEFLDLKTVGKLFGRAICHVCGHATPITSNSISTTEELGKMRYKAEMAQIRKVNLTMKFNRRKARRKKS